MEVQTSNLYTFRADRPAPGLELMAKPDTKRREFPQKRSLLDWLGDFDTTALETPDNEGSFSMCGSGTSR